MTNASLTSEPEKLLPCPFCGGEAETDRYSPEDETPEMAINCRGECEGIFIFSEVAASDFAGLRHAWNHRLSSPVSGTDGRERLALEAIKAVTATTKDAVRGLSRIMAITRSAGVDAPYNELMAKPDVALIVNSPRTEWRHLFERPEGCTIPPEGWTCSRTPGHDGPCAASPSTPIPVIVEAGERGDLIRDLREAELDWVDCGDDENASLARRAYEALSTPATLDNTAVEEEGDQPAAWALEAERAAADAYAQHMGDPDGNDDVEAARNAAALVIERIARATFTAKTEEAE